MWHVIAAAVGTAVWAVGVSAHHADVRVALAAAGAIAGCSFAVWPINPATDLQLSGLLGVVLIGYQHAIATAVRAHGPIAQAGINCNIAVIVAYTVAAGTASPTLMLASLAASTVASAAALVLYGQNDVEMRVPG